MQSVSAAFIDQRTNVGVIRKAPINGCLNRFGLPIRGGRKHKDWLERSAVVMIDCLLARSAITMNGGGAAFERPPLPFQDYTLLVLGGRSKAAFADEN